MEYPVQESRWDEVCENVERLYRNSDIAVFALYNKIIEKGIDNGSLEITTES